jgi:hypothetical protein
MKTKHGWGRVPLFLFASGSVLVIAPRAVRAESNAGACDALVDALPEVLERPAPRPAGVREPGYRAWEGRLERILQSTYDNSVVPRAFTTRVSAECRAEARVGGARQAVAAARSVTQRPEPGWVERGRILLCTMQDPASLAEVDGWIADRHLAAAQAVCASELATWPGAESVRGRVFAGALQRQTFGWQIDPALVAAANTLGTPELREALVPVLASAHERRAVGYDRLRDAVCADDAEMSEERGRACSSLPAEVEDEWPQSGRGARWLAKGAATAVFAGAVTAAAIERNQPASLGIAAAAGVPLGALLGSAPTGRDRRGKPTAGARTLAIVGPVFGGVFGGLLTTAVAARPAARAPVTALALAPVYVITCFALSID